MEELVEAEAVEEDLVEAGAVVEAAGEVEAMLQAMLKERRIQMVVDKGGAITQAEEEGEEGAIRTRPHRVLIMLEGNPSQGHPQVHPGFKTEKKVPISTQFLKPIVFTTRSN